MGDRDHLATGGHGGGAGAVQQGMRTRLHADQQEFGNMSHIKGFTDELKTL